MAAPEPAAAPLAFARPMPRGWYAREAELLARDLLGTLLVRRVPGGYRAVRLVETEAYVTGDPANHAYRGETARNRSMFGRPGTLYIFSLHGHHLANAVGRPGEAVLFRGGEPVVGVVAPAPGPGRLAAALGLTRAEDGYDLLRSEVRILPRRGAPFEIAVGPRIGISRARERPLRFWIPGRPGVSRPPPGYLSFAQS
ncbi:MAG: DNA-3-methyladenine glycosylase [Thermoplasmata archaeon]